MRSGLTWSCPCSLECSDWSCLMGWCAVWNQAQSIQNNHCMGALKKHYQYEWNEDDHSFRMISLLKTKLWAVWNDKKKKVTVIYHLECLRPGQQLSHRSSSVPHCGWCILHHPAWAVGGWRTSCTPHTLHGLVETKDSLDHRLFSTPNVCMFLCVPMFVCQCVRLPRMVRLKQPRRSPDSESAPHWRTTALGWYISITFAITWRSTEQRNKGTLIGTALCKELSFILTKKDTGNITFI